MTYLVALIFTAVWSRAHRGLWSYGTLGDNRYFVFQYLPSLVGMALLLWLFEIQIAVHRIAPFIALSSNSPQARSRGVLLPIYPSGFVYPTLAHFAAGQPAIGTFFIVSWLNIFTTPLLSTSFNVYNTAGSWVWLATQGVIWTVIVLYILLLISTIWLFAYLWRRQTGLKWDPTSLADFLVLLEGSNLLKAYAAYSDFTSVEDFRQQVEARGDALAYWRSSNRPNDIRHTLGALNVAVPSYSVVGTRLVEKSSPPFHDTSFDLESGRPHSHGTLSSLIFKSKRSSQASTVDHAEGPQEVLPWFVRPTFAVLWAVTAILLLLAFLVVSYLPATAIHTGFLPELPVPVNTSGFSSDNFLYSFIPSLLGLLCFLFWYTIDLNMRRLALYAALSSPGSSKADRSLLLSYSADGLLVVSIKALVNRHLRIAIISFTTLIAATLPVLAGGVFWAQFYVPQQRIRISGHMPAFYALTALVTLYALAYLLLPMTRRQSLRYSIPTSVASTGLGEETNTTYGLSNHGRSLVEIVALIHQSRLLTDSAFRAPESRTQLVTRLITAPASERLGRISSPRVIDVEKEDHISHTAAGPSTTASQTKLAAYEDARYGLGRYLGRNGKEYVGIDRVNRMGVMPMTLRGSEEVARYIP